MLDLIPPYFIKPLIDRGGGENLYFRLDIIFVKGLSKYTLNTYFSDMKIDLKYVFLHAFFLIYPSCPFPYLSIWPKTHPFFQFCTFAPLMRCTHEHCLVLKNNPNYMNLFYKDGIQLQIQVCPPPSIDYMINGRKTSDHLIPCSRFLLKKWVQTCLEKKIRRLKRNHDLVSLLEFKCLDHLNISNVSK